MEQPSYTLTTSITLPSKILNVYYVILIKFCTSKSVSYISDFTPLGGLLINKNEWMYCVYPPSGFDGNDTAGFSKMLSMCTYST